MREKIALIIAAALGIAVIVQGVVLHFARADAERYRLEAERLADSEAVLLAENARVKDMIARANDALERGLRQVEEAKLRYDERNQKIVESDPDWLVCPLPDGVRDAFLPDADGGDEAAVCAP